MEETKHELLSFELKMLKVTNKIGTVLMNTLIRIVKIEYKLWLWVSVLKIKERCQISRII